jgi:hypothetical protein
LCLVTVAETLLVYVGAPLLVVLVLWALTFLPGGRKKARWKSGQPWEHEPVWYEPHPGGSGGHGGGSGNGAGNGHAAIGPGATAAGALPAGSSAAEAAPVAGGPLGGARGTW